jgi:glucose-1-phosphate adenylyltransferase
MDALSGVYSYLRNIRQDYVVLAGGDLAANIPLGEVLEAHLKSGADITAVCTRRPIGEPRSSVYFTLGAAGLVADGSVGPALPMGCESLEVYILSRQLLFSLVDHCAAHGISSFSGGVLGTMASTLKISPWFFQGYAARLQSVEGYFARSMELLDPEVRANLFDPARAVRTKDRSDPSTYYGPGSKCVNSLAADGCIIEGEVENSILFRGVRVEKGARVSNCILMQSAVICRGALMKYAVADKNVFVNPGRMLMGHETYPLAIVKDAVI